MDLRRAISPLPRRRRAEQLPLSTRCCWCRFWKEARPDLFWPICNDRHRLVEKVADVGGKAGGLVG